MEEEHVAEQQLSYPEELILNANEEIIKNTNNVAYNFCKTMISLSLGAIPVFIGLIQFIKPENLKLTDVSCLLKLYIILSPLFFIASAVIFVIGYKPRKSDFQNDLPVIIKNYNKTVNKRNFWINIGLVVFFIAVIISITNLFLILY